AEDGIRVATVTGVQTCALPILLDRGRAPERATAEAAPSAAAHTADRADRATRDRRGATARAIPWGRRRGGGSARADGAGADSGQLPIRRRGGGRSPGAGTLEARRPRVDRGRDRRGPRVADARRRRGSRRLARSPARDGGLGRARLAAPRPHRRGRASGAARECGAASL